METTVTITRENNPTPSKRRRTVKGRAFSATLLAYIQADALVKRDKPDVNVIRPAWAQFVATDAAMTPFKANLVKGGRAAFPKTSYGREATTYIEFLRSMKYRATTQRIADDPDTLLVLTMDVPALFNVDGQDDHDGIHFIAATPRWWGDDVREWVDGQPDVRSDLDRFVRTLNALPGTPWQGALVGDVADEAVRVSAYTMLHLARRTRLPIVNDVRFFLQAYLFGLHHQLFTLARVDPKTYYHDDPRDAWAWARRAAIVARGTREIGLHDPVGCGAASASVKRFLADEARRYDSLTVESSSVTSQSSTLLLPHETEDAVA